MQMTEAQRYLYLAIAVACFPMLLFMCRTMYSTYKKGSIPRRGGRPDITRRTAPFLFWYFWVVSIFGTLGAAYGLVVIIGRLLGLSWSD